jgi:hypothetical protein
MHYASIRTTRWSAPSRMGLIYSTAEVVLLWLGEESHNSRIAFRQLQEREPERAFSSTTWRQCSSSLNQELATCPQNPLQSLFKHPYWRRAWIIQEISKAQRIMVFCGRDVISWAKLTNGFKRFKNGDHDLIVPPEVLSLRTFRNTEQAAESPQSPQSSRFCTIHYL